MRYLRGILILIFISCWLNEVSAQTAPDITFTDIHGTEHNLYETLDAGKTVLLDFFFVDCIPCRDWTPTIETLYNTWGAGLADVVFWAFSDVDDNSYIQEFAEEFDVQYTLTGLDGGAFEVIAQYASEFSFVGYPTYSVICPDRSISWDIWPLSDGAPEIDEKISECGASGIVTADGPDQEILIGCIWPNPAENFIQVPVQGRIANGGTLQIYSAQGKLEIEKTILTNSDVMNISISDLAEGMYVILVIMNGDILARDKFMKI